jgi:TolB-like protein
MTAARRLAAILAADVVGYSSLMGEDEAGTAKAVRERREAATPIVRGFGGRLVKTTGDGVLLEFPSVVAAVECAIAIQRMMAERNAEIPEAKRILYRVGVNLGDILIDGDDILGDGVNVAARLEGIAEPGGICLSEDAWRQVRDKVNDRFIDLGEKTLKNIARPVRVYALKSGASAPAVAARAEKSGAPRLSLVVLPFANIGGDASQDYFVDGVTESLTTDLSRISGAFVIGRSTAFSYKGKAVDLRQIGRELNVRYVLEGSVQRGGARLRVNVQLIEAETSQHLWAERFEKPITDLFDMQDEIVSRLANQLEAELISGGAPRGESAQSRFDGPLFSGAGRLQSWCQPRFAGDRSAGVAQKIDRREPQHSLGPFPISLLSRASRPARRGAHGGESGPRRQPELHSPSIARRRGIRQHRVPRPRGTHHRRHAHGGRTGGVSIAGVPAPHSPSSDGRPSGRPMVGAG